MKKITVFISIALNILLLAVLLFTFNHYGVFGKVIAKVSGQETSVDSIIDTPYYLLRENVTESTTISDDTVVFAGDSLTDINNWENSLPNKNISNFGINGDTTLGVLNRVESIVQNQPNKVFLLVGVNDIIRGIDSKTILKNYNDILNAIKEESPKTEVFVQSLTPLNEEMGKEYYQVEKGNETVSSLNTELEKLANSNNVTYIDIHSDLLDKDKELKESLTLDGLHLNNDGYKVWAKVVEKYLK